MKDVESLSEKLEHYKKLNPTDPFVAEFLKLLVHPDAFQRTHLPGHITGSAFIASPDFSQTLLVHHVKLNRWLQPGGHADGDADILRVALREVHEETGLSKVTASSSDIFDLDIHLIPTRKDFPEHLHYDVRFLVLADTSERIQVSEESHDVKWILMHELDQYTSEISLLRMRDKLKDVKNMPIRP